MCAPDKSCRLWKPGQGRTNLWRREGHICHMELFAVGLVPPHSQLFLLFSGRISNGHPLGESFGMLCVSSKMETWLEEACLLNVCSQCARSGDSPSVKSADGREEIYLRTRCLKRAYITICSQNLPSKSKKERFHLLFLPRDQVCSINWDWSKKLACH